MFKVFSGHAGFNHPMLSKSEFGLWFIHKASYAFTGSDQVDLIIQRIYQVDELNQTIIDCADKNQVLGFIQQIRDLNREIQLLVDQLFQVAEYIESGNDSLTQLLNRRYLNTIISREITFSRKIKRLYLYSLLMPISLKALMTNSGIPQVIWRSSLLRKLCRNTVRAVIMLSGLVVKNFAVTGGY